MEQGQTQSKEQLDLLQTITMEVAAASGFVVALEIVLREVCEKTGWVLGHAWVRNSEAGVLDLVAAWYCGDGELKPFKAASEGSHFEPGVGLPGRVWESKQPAWIEDVTGHGGRQPARRRSHSRDTQPRADGAKCSYSVKLDC
jgi:signal transduction protein with GAF and PtsI domain